MKTKQKHPPEVFCRKGVLRSFAKFTGKHLCHGHFFNKVAGLWPAIFFKKKALVQVFSCEFCKISKNIFSTEHPQTTASDQKFSLRFLKVLQLTLYL